MSIENKIQLIANSGIGRFIPEQVVKYNKDAENWDWSEVDDEDIGCILRGPDDNEHYWDAWDNAMNNLKIKGFDGHTYTLMYNEDLWAVRDDATEEELENWMI